MKKIDVLTGIRAFAAIWVVLLHTYEESYAQASAFQWLRPLIDKGYLGVDLFFILSGFVISYVHFKEFSTYSSSFNTTVRFYGLRLARILPVHYVMLFAYGLLYLATVYVVGIQPIHPNDFTADTFVYNLFNVQAWGFSNELAWNIPAWSISAEWLAYLTFPLISPLMGKIKNWVNHEILILCLFAILVICHNQTTVKLHYWSVGGLAILRVLSEFTMGCSLYQIYRHTSHSDDNLVASGKIWDGIALAVLVMIITLIMNGAADLIVAFLFPLFLLALCKSDGWFSKLFTNRISLVMGEISFSIYMVHQICILVIGKSLSLLANKGVNLMTYSDAFILLTVGISCVLAYALFQWVEIPARTQLRNWLYKLFPKESDFLQPAGTYTTTTQLSA